MIAEIIIASLAGYGAGAGVTKAYVDERRPTHTCYFHPDCDGNCRHEDQWSWAERAWATAGWPVYWAMRLLLALPAGLPYRVTRRLLRGKPKPALPEAKVVQR